MPHFGTVAAARRLSIWATGDTPVLSIVSPVVSPASLLGKEVKQSTVAWNVLTMA